MRALKESEGNCILKEKNNELKYQYLCEVYEDATNIKQIKVEPDFNFGSQNNITLVGVSPLAKRVINNIQLIDEKYDLLSNSTVFLLDNSTFDKYDKFLLNISGIINEPQPKFENKNLSVMVDLQSENKQVTNIDCIINNITEKNYILNCKVFESLVMNLQSSISFIDYGDILLINFDNNNNNSIISFEKNGFNLPNRRINSGALKPGIIAALIITLVVVLAFIIFAVIYFRKKNIQLENYTDSTIRNLKN
jgi:hypothetical protein